MKKLLLLFSVATSYVYGQSVTAASCSQSDVTNAFNTINQPVAVLNIPAGTCIWTNSSTVIFQAPTNSTSLTILGAGNQGVIGGGDQTVIIDHSPGQTLMTFQGSKNQTLLRISGITFKQDSGSVTNTNGVIGFFGGPESGLPDLRVDHCHFWAGPESGQGSLLGIIFGWTYGVFDHDLFNERSGGVEIGVRIGTSSAYQTVGPFNGNGSWDHATQFGSSQFLFFEDNIYNNSISNDCFKGGRFVMRHNSYNRSSILTHEMEGDDRGCRAFEAYQNTFTGQNGDTVTSFVAAGIRMGTALVWGNSSTFMENLITMANDRTNGHPFATPPNGYGYCGTTGTIAGPSAWDGNTSGSIGYPCIDQPGRGQSDTLLGQFPNKCDTTTGCLTVNGTWPHNLLEPIYEWLNKYQIGTWQNNIMFNQDSNNFGQNRDYYLFTQAWNGSTFTGTAFNGTVGTGSGLLSSRPPTCTAGPGGTFGNSPTGSFGVGYWATDVGNGGTLYICTATNTWTSYYTPFTYPHPLVGSGPQLPTITTTSPLPNAIQGSAYSTTLVATNGPITWAISSGTLPTGLSLASSTGVISGTATGTSQTFGVTATNSAGSSSSTFTLNVIIPPTITSTSPLPTGQINVSYSNTLMATGSTPITWGITSGALPNGLNLNSSTGVISGIPGVVGTSTFTLQASNSGGSNPKTFNLTINPAPPTPPTITTTSPLPGGTQNVAYSTTIAVTGTAPITCAVTGGSLPTGLSLGSSSCIISGVPTGSGASSFTVTATNGAGTNPKTFSLTITAAVVPPNITTLSPLPQGTINVAYATTIVATGSTPITWALVTGALPVGFSLDPTTGIVSGSASVAATYNFTVSATNSAGSTQQAYTLVISGSQGVVIQGIVTISGSTITQ